MTSIVTYELSNGAVVGVEMAPGAELVGTDRVPSIDFEQVKRVIEGIGSDLGDAIQRLAPSTGTLEFGIEMGGEAGVPFVAKGTATAHVTVTLEWTSPSPS